MARVGTGVGDGSGATAARCARRPGLPGLAALLGALGVLGVGACDPGATDDPQRFGHTLAAAPGPERPDGGPLAGTDPRLVWAPVVSPEATERLAARYCADLAPHGPAPWRVPTADELGGAPLDRFPFLPGEFLWTVDRPAAAHHRRVVVDPRTRIRASRAPAQALHLRVLCVAEAP